MKEHVNNVLMLFGTYLLNAGLWLTHIVLWLRIVFLIVTSLITIMTFFNTYKTFQKNFKTFFVVVFINYAYDKLSRKKKKKRIYFTRKNTPDEPA